MLLSVLPSGSWAALLQLDPSQWRMRPWALAGALKMLSQRESGFPLAQPTAHTSAGPTAATPFTMSPSGSQALEWGLDANYRNPRLSLEPSPGQLCSRKLPWLRKLPYLLRH